MNQVANSLGKLLTCGFLVFAAPIFPVTAQITPDNTLGTESSRLDTNVLINNVLGDKINGGAQRDTNLFHSFSEFNINDGQRVYFSNPSGVINILTRVTGGNASNILGTLGVDGNANLFLMNPNGILFGQNARLDVQGSFVGTTANGLQFGNQGVFSATNPQAPGLLTVNPSALFFNQLNQGEIRNRTRFNENDSANSALFFPQQGSRFFVGGDVIFDGGQTFTLNNRLELGGLKAEGSIGLIGNGNEMRLAFSEDVPRADVVLQNGAAAITPGGGAITVNARNLSFSATSFIGTVLRDGEGTPGVAAEDVTINATGTVSLDGESFITNQGFDNSLGDSGNVIINAQSIRLNNNSQIATGGQRNRGNISLNATEDITLDSNSLINTFGSRDSIGKAGDINLNAKTINLSNQAAINSGNIGQGQGGKTTLQAQENIFLSSGAIISSASGASVFGGTNNEPSGDIEIKARSLFLDGDYTSISSRNFDDGRAGDIRITTDNSISLNQFANITSSTTGEGEGGNIQLQTGRLIISNGGVIDTLTRGVGNSGDLLINAADSVTLTGSKLISSERIGSFLATSRIDTNSQGSGNGGKLTINTGKLSLIDGGKVNSVVGIGLPGQGGDININATESIEVVGVTPNGDLLSGIVAGTLGSGNSGNLSITTPSLSVRDGGTVSTSANKDSTGEAGNLTINASDSVEVVGVSPDNRFFTDISSITLGSGDAGDMTINTGRLSIRSGAIVGTGNRSGSKGRGGNLIVNASESVEVVGRSPDGQLSSILEASSRGAGNAGNITINTRRLSIRDIAVVGTSTFSSGQGGTLTVNASDLVEVVGKTPDGQFSSVLSASTFGSGDAGNININTRRLSVRDGGFISTDVPEGSTGKGGDMTIDASDLVEVISNTPDDAFSSNITTFTSSSGDAGRLNITTSRLNIGNGGFITTSTGGSGQGGDIDINATDSVEIFVNPNDIDLTDGIFAGTSGSGRGGNINIRTQRLNVRNGGSIATGTVEGSTGKGGNLTVNASEFVEVSGTSNDNRLQSFLSVRSRGEGQAGNILVNSPRITVKDKGVINAESFTTDGGNITLNSNLLLLRRGGTVSTTAGTQQAPGNGGNITLNTVFIVAVPGENSDITANAFTGKGGQINITTQGIFGIEPRAQASDATNDITASSQLGIQGEIAINNPEIDPTKGIIELPNEVVDATNQLSQLCPRGYDAFIKPLSSFTITGRDALPLSPLEPLQGTATIPLATLDNEGNAGMQQRTNNTFPLSASPHLPLSASPHLPISASSLSPSPRLPLTSSSPFQIIEAQGLVKNSRGEIFLVAQAPQTTPSSQPTISACL
ncbi:filamentous hemagglutinin N-terminal domain-containing protein [Calothrix sp. UHCC 0171]|uniref:two-partner secretion domain-containing protein n=1 Tax=Calothrix sp. UHCC 0171 TaxID=3110245 RepID=UPI002B21B1B0|nr:filamentous hemagglutinin N-terminal domain-containing protein [Calothrix sp. UHCC 0171]MEA5572568.1 filamentous hemagglutinin N-terminal domain-containing protein [Calothrix sp. UHCC 0171]